MRKYIVVPPPSDYGKLMWQDLKGEKNIKVLDNPYIIKNKIKYAIYRIHFSYAINKKISLPFKGIWKSIYPLEEIEFNKKDNYIIIFTDVSVCCYSAVYLERLKSNPNVKLVLMIVNSMNRMKKVIKDQIKVFDYIYTFDKRDAEIYKFRYYPAIYSKVDISSDKDYKPVDAFFVGVAKDRLNFLLKVFDKLNSKGYDANFYIAKVKKRDQVYRKGIVYNKWLDYKEVLGRINKAKCIVEIMDGNNSGVTLRTLEAVCYNKKLLTNNKKLQYMPIYNEKYMQIFEDINEINLDFINDSSPVDYSYKNNYSPKNFIKTLEKDISD
ncbi:CgeB family protein [Caldifermentibacillus hisashii]|uniref:hypothetical protein n=1 Tax=Caldifermentibacillus hisashii TaxID=996558 RepID=UPI0022B9B398|nr:hypothetical protein [Caldifermentibacillus hisashii]